LEGTSSSSLPEALKSSIISGNCGEEAQSMITILKAVSSGMMGHFRLRENSDVFLLESRKIYRGLCENLSPQRQAPGKISVDP
jgi:hypothetical protein